MYLRFALYAPVSLVFNLLVILTCWLWALWAAYTPRATLPKPFHLVHTHDDNIYGMRLAGPVPGSWWGRVKRAVWWLCRNPGYGFDAYVLGFHEDSITTRENAGGTLEAGQWLVYRLSTGRRFRYRRDWYYTKTGTRYCKLYFGWKKVGGHPQHMLVFDINPFKKREAPE